MGVSETLPEPGRPTERPAHTCFLSAQGVACIGRVITCDELRRRADGASHDGDTSPHKVESAAKIQ